MKKIILTLLLLIAGALLAVLLLNVIFIGLLNIIEAAL